VPYHTRNKSMGALFQNERRWGARDAITLRAKRLLEPSRAIQREGIVLEASGTIRLSLAALWYRDCL
jgi:hypothetical protein